MGRFEYSLWLFVTLIFCCSQVTVAQNQTLNETDPNGQIVNEDPFSLFEGDIVGFRPFNDAFYNGITSKENLWPNRVIPYEISSIFSDKDKQTILAAIREFDEKTCLTFRPKNPSDDYSIFIDNAKDGCFAYWGRQLHWQLRGVNKAYPHLGNRQLVNLQRGGCVWHSTVQHEIMHAIGFLHEQSRPDRDDYVDIIWDNIKPGQDGQFRKQMDSDPQGTPYDFASVMHYSSTAFSKNDGETIRPKPKYTGKTFGSKTGLSPIDIQKIHTLYKCDGKDPTGESSGSRTVQAYYSVKPEDTVMSIARKLGRDWQQIAKDNHISNPGRISPGKVLFIKGP